MKTDEKSNGWGGAREGAGRKPRLQYEARELFNATVDRYADKLVRAAIYYAAQGDKDMLRYLIDQRMGKASQSMDVSARSLMVNVSAQQDDPDKIDVMRIAEGVAAELKKLKTA